MKNILFVVDERMLGGVSILLNDILNNINIKKYNIDVMVLHNRGEFLDDLPESVNIIYGTKFFDVVDFSLTEILKTKSLRKILKKLYLIFLMKTGLIKKKIIKERKKCISKNYDVEVAFKDGFCAIFTAFGDSKRKYHWLHTDYSMYDCTQNYKNLFVTVFSKFDKIIAISNSVLKKFKEKYDVQKTDVIYNLVNKDKIIKMSNEEEVTYDTNKLNLISVGRIHNMKGYDRLINVFKKLNDKRLIDNVILRIVGDGPDFKLISNMVKEYKLSDKVLLLGKKKNPFIYLKHSDAFLMCSRYEPFGLVVLESMILKVPVISTKVASINEIMDNKYGMIVDNSCDGLEKAIKKIAKEKNILNKYRSNLKDYEYKTDEIINKIEKLLDEE